jgi:hypothetical protein
MASGLQRRRSAEYVRRSKIDGEEGGPPPGYGRDDVGGGGVGGGGGGGGGIAMPTTQRSRSSPGNEGRQEDGGGGGGGDGSGGTGGGGAAAAGAVAHYRSDDVGGGGGGAAAGTLGGGGGGAAAASTGTGGGGGAAASAAIPLPRTKSNEATSISAVWARLAVADALERDPDTMVEWWVQCMTVEHQSAARRLGTTMRRLVDVLVDVLRALDVHFERCAAVLGLLYRVAPQLLLRLHSHNVTLEFTLSQCDTRVYTLTM